MERAVPLDQAISPPRSWRRIPLGLVLAALLGIIAFLPYDLPLFVPAVPNFLDASIFSVRGLASFLATAWTILAVEAIFAFVIIVCLIADRRFSRRWPALVKASLLVLITLVALDHFLLIHRPVIVVLFAGFTHGLGGIPIPVDLSVFFFAALAAGFAMGEVAPGIPGWSKAALFSGVGAVAVAGGALFHALLLLRTHGQDTGMSFFLFDLFVLCSPLLLVMGVLGGISGGFLRVACVSLFAASPAAGALEYSREGERGAQPGPSTSRARLVWAITWRCTLAAIVGVLVGGHLFSLSLWFSLNGYMAPRVLSVPWAFLIPLAFLLLLASILLQPAFWRSRRAGWGIGIGVLCFLWIMAVADLLELLLFLWVSSSSSSYLTAMYWQDLLVSEFRMLLGAVMLATMVAFALGGMGWEWSKRRRRLFSAGLGMAAFLAALPGEVNQYHQGLTASFFQGSLLIPVLILVILGLMLAALGGLLGGWLHTKAAAWSTRLR